MFIFIVPTVKYDLLNASSYIPLPKFASSKKTCNNVDNTDEKCFILAILAALCSSEKNKQRHTNHRKNVGKLNFKGIPFPVSIKDVPKFEFPCTCLDMNSKLSSLCL